MLTGAMLLLFVVATEATEAASFEWAGTFETPGAAYVWTAQSGADGLYVDPGMKMVILPTTGTSEDALRSLETGAESAFATTCVDAQVGTVLTPAPGACYQLNFNAKLHTSIFEIDTTGVGAIAVFAEHFPIEFERDMHYFKDVAGEDVEPVAELPAADEPEKPYGEAIGASFLVMVCTLIGVVFVVPIFAQLAKDNMSATMAVTSAFAAGALLACSFYLMLYEATHLIVKPNEADAAAMWGSMILLGFITAPILDFVAQAVIGTGKAEAPTSASRTTDAEEGKETQVTVEAVNTVVTDASSRVRVLCGVLLGDFMHNLVDGVFIGAAFMGCSSSKAWSITAATVYHELAQEISDYFILTSPTQGALKPPLALLLNFLSGFSVLFGVLIVLEADPSNETQGMLLAFGAGVYLQIGASECMPRVYECAKSFALRSGCLFAFFVGALAIGLVLLDHEHCSGNGGDAHGH